MADKIKVTAKAQNRIALGIFHAYKVLYPQATLEDFRRAFPNELNPDSGTKEIFIPAEEKGTTANWDGYFKGEDELITDSNGQKVAVVKMWTKPSLDKVTDHAAQYGIKIEKVDADGLDLGKAKFKLDYLNGFTPSNLETATVTRKLPLWMWLLVGGLVVASVLVLCLVK